MSTGVIGIDIGGTKIAAGLVDVASGNISDFQTEPTPVAGGGEAVLAAVSRIAAVLDTTGVPVGIAVPELVDLQGHVQSAFQFDWRDLDISGALSPHPVVVESDVRAAALAEARVGAASGSASALYVSIGTGISSCLVIDGQPWRGNRGNALVLASGDTSALDATTDSLVRFVLEEIAAGPALVRRYAHRSGERISTADVLIRAEIGDADALHVVTTAADALGSAIGQAVNVLDPERVVIGGGLGLAGGTWWSLIEAAIRRSIWSEETRTLAIVPAALGTRAGVIGAALAAAETLPQRSAHLQEVACNA